MKNQTIKLPALSVFFPAYNEQGNIQIAVEEALKFLPNFAEKFEIIVVDDGSTDQTLKIARKLAKKYSQVKVVTQTNQGYGGAVNKGLESAKYDWIFYTDSDLQFDLSELSKFLNFTANYQFVIGYRLKRVEGWQRQLLATLLKIWNRIFLGFPNQVRDVDCAFKLIHRSVFDQIKPLASKGAMVSTELLLKVHYSGIPYHQIGVHHYPRRHGTPTGNNLKVIWLAAKETWRLRQLLSCQAKTQFQIERL